MVTSWEEEGGEWGKGAGIKKDKLGSQDGGTGDTLYLPTQPKEGQKQI